MIDEDAMVGRFSRPVDVQMDSPNIAAVVDETERRGRSVHDVWMKLADRPSSGHYTAVVRSQIGSGDEVPTVTRFFAAPLSNERPYEVVSTVQDGWAYSRFISQVSVLHDPDSLDIDRCYVTAGPEVMQGRPSAMGDAVALSALMDQRGGTVVIVARASVASREVPVWALVSGDSSGWDVTIPSLHAIYDMSGVPNWADAEQRCGEAVMMSTIRVSDISSDVVDMSRCPSCAGGGHEVEPGATAPVQLVYGVCSSCALAVIHGYDAPRIPGKLVMK